MRELVVGGLVLALGILGWDGSSLALYNPTQLYAVNRAAEFVPYGSGILHLFEASVTDRHWSVRKGAAKP